jgi:hypothetical protein
MARTSAFPTAGPVVRTALCVALLAGVVSVVGCGDDDAKTGETAESNKSVTEYDIVEGEAPVAEEVVALDAFVRPVLEGVYGSVGIAAQSEAGAPVVSVRYEVGKEVTDADPALIAEGLQAAGGQPVPGETVVDFSRPEAPVVQVRADVGGVARTVRVTFEPGTTIVFVNATG